MTLRKDAVKKRPLTLPGGTVDNWREIHMGDWATRGACYGRALKTGNQDEFFGSGEKQFNRSMGVACFDKTVCLADMGNDRILRFKLSMDIQ